MKVKKKIIKKVKPQKASKKLSNKLLTIIGSLFISLFMIVFFSSQPQILRGNAAQPITPTFGSIGDCNANGTCPSGAIPSGGGQQISIVPGTSGSPQTSISPSGAVSNPCIAAKDAKTSAMSRRFKGSSGGFSQFILQLFQLILQLLQQLFGGNISMPGSGQTPSIQPSQAIQPSNAPNPSQSPCPPSNSPQPSGSQQPSSSTPTAQPTGTTNQKCADSGSAAANYNWGCPTDGDEFNGTSIDTSIWNVYNSAGNGGNGLRRPSQITESGGIMIMSGTANGTTGGMKSLSNHKAQYGRWEVKMRVLTQGSGGPYHPVIALVPYGIPYDGTRDLDFAETNVGTGVEYVFLHYNGLQDYKSVNIDISQWHYYALEAAPNHMTWFVDGKPIITDTTAAAMPPYTMEMNVQLDANQQSGLAPSQQELDFFRYYPLPAGGAPIIQAPAPSTGRYR